MANIIGTSADTICIDTSLVCSLSAVIHSKLTHLKWYYPAVVTTGPNVAMSNNTKRDGAGLSLGVRQGNQQQPSTSLSDVCSGDSSEQLTVLSCVCILIFEPIQLY